MSDSAPVHLGTGEILEHLETRPPAEIAEALHFLRDRRKEFDDWERALDTELRRRLKDRQTKQAIFDGFEVTVASTRESVWDAEQLEAAMAELAEHGTVPAAEMTGIITRDPVVSRSKARELQKRLDGDARKLIDECVTWQEKRGRLTVTRAAGGAQEEAIAGDRDDPVTVTASGAGNPPLSPVPPVLPQPAPADLFDTPAPAPDTDPFR